MSKLQRCNEKINILKNYPQYFKINLYSYIKPNQYKRLKAKRCTTFGDVARLNSIEDLHMRASTMINHALRVLFEEKDIPYLKKHLNALEKKPIPKTRSIYRLLNGHKTAKKFSKKAFFEIFNPEDVKDIGTKYKYKLTRRDNTTVYCSSMEERTVIKKMDRHRDFKLLRTQFPKIDNGKNGYHPDIFMLTRTNRIAIIEVKRQFNMKEEESQRQYKLLKDYCIKHGYLYMMCDKKFKEYETLDQLVIPKRIENYMNNVFKVKGCFEYEDYINLLPKKNDKKYFKRKNKIENFIGRYIKKYNLKKTGQWTSNLKIYR